MNTSATSYSAPPLGAMTDGDTETITETTITTTSSSDLPLIIIAAVTAVSSIIFFVLSHRDNKDE